MMFTLALVGGAVFFLHSSIAATPQTALKDQAVAKTDSNANAKANVLLDIDGKIYPRDNFPETCKEMLHGVKCTEKAFGTYHVESKKEGDQIYSKATFSDPETVQVTEQSWEKDGHVVKAIVENSVLKKTSELEVKNGKVTYKTTDKTDGSVKTSEDDAEPNLVVPSTVMSYIRPFNSQLLDGKDVILKVAVMDRRESFTFKIKKYREEKAADGEEVMVLQMAPTSLIVKALVDPMYFYVKAKTGEMYAFEGKSALRRKDGDKYKELVVRSEYQYNVNQFRVADASGGVTAAKFPGSTTCSEAAIKSGEAKCSVNAPGSTDSSNKN
jgi:hypothetical protein